MHGLDAGGQWTQHLWISLPKQSLVEVLGSTIWQSTSWDVPQISFIVKYLLPSAFWAILREVCALDLLHSFDYVFSPSVLSASVVCKLCMHNPQLPFQCTCVVFMWLNAPVFRWNCNWLSCDRNVVQNGINMTHTHFYSRTHTTHTHTHTHIYIYIHTQAPHTHAHTS